MLSCLRLHSQNSKPVSNRHGGFTLIEAAILLLFISIAMFPIIRMIGGVKNNSGSSTSTLSALSRFKTQQVALANSLMERALAQDVSAYLGTQSLGPNESLTTPITQYGSYNTKIWYNWELHDVSYKTNAQGNLIDAQGNIITNQATDPPVLNVPNGDLLIQGTLRVYDQQNSTQPSLVLPAILFRNVQGATNSLEKTGVNILLDISGSMVSATDDWQAPLPSVQPVIWPSNLQLAAPFLKYRYSAGLPNGVKLDLNDNTQLDLATAAPADDPTTPNNDLYPATTNAPWNIPSVCATRTTWPGLGGNSPGGQMMPFFNDNAVQHQQKYFQYQTYTPPPNSVPIIKWDNVNNQPIDVPHIMNAFCTDKSQWTSQQLTMFNDNYMPRIEQARSSLLSLLLTLESNPTVAQNLKLGFQTFSDHANDAYYPLEDATYNSQYQQYRFNNSRLYFSYINRDGAPVPISATGSTDTYDGVYSAAEQLNKAGNLSQKLLILATDGEPNPATGNNTDASLINLAKSLGDGTFTGRKPPSTSSNGQPITLYTIGVIGVTPTNHGGKLLKAMATSTPNGQFIPASNTTEFKNIMDQIAYLIEKLTLLNAAKRYGVQYPGA